MRKILLVDDEATVRRILSLALARAGYDVVTAANGEEALEQIRAESPDVLITDVEMPRMDGQGLCHALVAEFPERRFPIIVLTSLTERDLRKWSREIDNLHFLEKPVSVRKLLSHLNGQLSEKATASAS